MLSTANSARLCRHWRLVFSFPVPPSIVRSEQKRKLVKKLPLSSLLVETDSPVLGPAPHERNEPANAVIVVRAIAELKGVSETEVMEAVGENARKLYRITIDDLRLTNGNKCQGSGSL